MILWPFATCEIAIKILSFCPAAIVMIPSECRQDLQARAVYEDSLLYDGMPSLVWSSETDYYGINEALGDDGSSIESSTAQQTAQQAC